MRSRVRNFFHRSNSKSPKRGKDNTPPRLNEPEPDNASSSRSSILSTLTSSRRRDRPPNSPTPSIAPSDSLSTNPVSAIQGASLQVPSTAKQDTAGIDSKCIRGGSALALNAVSEPTEPEPAIPKVDHWKEAYDQALQKLTKKEQEAFTPNNPLWCQHSTGGSISAEIVTNPIASLDRMVEQQTATEAEQVFMGPVKQKLHGFLKTLHKYAPVVDTAIQHHPDITALVWAATRFFLQVYIQHSEAREALQKTITKIVSTMATCEFYAKIYVGSLRVVTLNSGRTTDDFRKALESALPSLYAVVLVFTVKAKTYFSSPIEKLKVACMSFESSFKDYIEDIENKEVIMRKLADMSIMETIMATSESLQEQFQILQQQQEQLNEIKTGVQKLLDENDHKTIREYRSWLDASDPEAEYQRAIEQQKPTTCEWLPERPEFQNWLSGKEGIRYLLMVGKPGAGKTVLSAATIQRLRTERFPGREVICFFFRDRGASTHKAADMIASLLDQLIHTETNQAPTLHLAKKATSTAAPKRTARTGVAELWELFLQTAQCLPQQITVVLDALDECPDYSQLVDQVQISDLCMPNNVRFFITTRRLQQDIFTRLHSNLKKRLVQLSMDVDDDIRTLVVEHVQTSRSLRLKKHQKDILEAIEKGADGMLRYAALMLHELDIQIKRSVTDILQSMPKGLPGIYHRILVRLGEEQPGSLGIRSQVLQWITVARRPVTFMEMIWACETAEGEPMPDFNPDSGFSTTRDYILDACGPLVEIFDGDKLRFTHLSVKEFLLSNNLSDDPLVKSCLVVEEDAHRRIALNCVTLLLSVPVANQNTQVLGPGWAPLAYSAVFWGFHAYQAQKLAENSTTTNTVELAQMWDMVLLFLQGSKFDVWCAFLTKHVGIYGDYDYLEAFLEWQCGGLISVNSLIENLQENYDRLGPLVVAVIFDLGISFQALLTSPPHRATDRWQTNLDHALLWAAYLGKRDMVRQLLEKGVKCNMNPPDRYWCAALHTAARAGRVEIVEMVLANGANVNAQGVDHGTALYAACEQGHEDTVQKLLDHKADVNAQGGYYGNALRAACVRGHEALVQNLLDHKADVNARGGTYGNALYAACVEKHEAIVQKLLDHKADVNAQGGFYGNALQAACAEQHEAIVQKLLDHKADVNAQGGAYGNALQAACAQGREAIVQKLLDHKADVNAQGGEYGNALQAACASGHQAIVQKLLDHKADVNAQVGEYGNALQAACARGREAIVQKLLDHKADVNAQGGFYGNALQAACAEQHEAIVQKLLDHKADVSAQGGAYGNALQAACAQGREAIVQKLLDHKADVNAQGGEYGNALQAACASGHQAIVQKLLDHKADVNAQGGEYGNALQAACARGREAIVQKLLDHKADVNAQGGEYGNALQAACARGREAIVQKLLGHKADVNAQGGAYGNALQAACASGVEAIIVQKLLESGADPNVPRVDRLTLQGAIHQWKTTFDKHETLQFLVKHGADVDREEGDSSGLLLFAALTRHEKVCSLLLAHGATLKNRLNDDTVPEGIMKYIEECRNGVILSGPTPTASG